MQTVLPLVFENIPVAHEVQFTGEIDALKGLLVPGLQSVHWSSPVEFPKEPAAHGRHAVFKLAPGNGLYVPVSHAMQDDDELEPTLGLKVPASHSLQLMAGAPPGL